MSVWADLCMPVSWTVEVEEFSIDKAWIAGAFFLGLFVGGAITFLIIPPCLKDWEKKKRQDEEENVLVANEYPPDEVIVVTRKGELDDEESGNKVQKTGKFARASAFFKRKGKKGKDAEVQHSEEKGWVKEEDGGKGGTKTVETETVGMMGILINPKPGEAEADLTKQDLDDMNKMDKVQKQAKDDMLLKMLKMKLRKMKGKGQMGESYLADFTQKVVERRKGNKEMIDQEQKDGEEEIRNKHKKNKATMEAELDHLNIHLDSKRRQLDKDELEDIRKDLIRTSGLSEGEVDDMLEKLKNDMAELERRQGIEQARQARHLTERLEKRRQLLEFRKFQEQQNRDEATAEVNAFEDPLQKLVDDGKLLDRQKKDLLDEHDRNLQNLQKQQDIDALRLQQDLAEKLQNRRAARLIKLQDKHMKEQASLLQKSEKSTNTTEFADNYQTLVEQQQQETEAIEDELDQTEIQELDKLTQSLDVQKENAMKEMSDKMVQSAVTMGQLPDQDVKRIIKLHNMRMNAYENRRKEELERMRAKLHERWERKLQKLDRDEERNQEERDTVLEQQDNTVKRVLNSNLDLTDEAKEKILKEHERNMVSLNNQMARSKAKQQSNLEHKLSQRRVRLAEIKAQQEAAKAAKKEMSEKEMQKLQNQLDEEMLLFDKEKKEAENALRKHLAIETETALAQQEREMAALIGRLEVGHARRMAVLQKQDEQLKELQSKVNRDQLENKIESGRLSSNAADQIIQQHYNQVEHVNDIIQNNRERQEQIINEKIQAKKFKKQRELEDQMRQEKEEMQMVKRRAGAGLASNILNASLMEQRHKKAMEELESEMQVELEKSREQLNNELQKSLEKELETHKGEFLSQLAVAAKQQAASDYDRGRRSSARGRYEGKSSLGTMEEDSEGADQ